MLRSLATPTLFLALTSQALFAQSSTVAASTPTPDRYAAYITRTLYLSNVATQADANEIVTALRNILSPNNKVFLVSHENALLIYASPEQITLAERLLKELDRPRRSYRLTYTITTYDHGDRVGTEHFNMVVVAGDRTVMKQGSRLPVVTGTYNAGQSSSQAQYTYLDIGMNFDASLEESAAGVRLRSKIENTAVAPDQSSPGVTDPVIRQTLLEGTSILTPGKPLILGSIDLPGTTRHLDVAVTMDLAS